MIEKRIENDLHYIPGLDVKAIFVKLKLTSIMVTDLLLVFGLVSPLK